MNITQATTVVAAFTALAADGGGRPLFTYIDDDTGERTELSAATLANWVAKTANLLTDAVGVGIGDVAAVRLPPHWQTAAVLLGCWSAGLAISLEGSEPAQVGFTTPDHLADLVADETYALALHPLGQPFRTGPPAGTLDYVREVRGHGDHFTGRPVTPADPALVPGLAPSSGSDRAGLGGALTHGALVDAARAVGVPARQRVLIDGDELSDPVSWLVAPIVAASSVVLCHRLDPAKVSVRLATERAVVFPMRAVP